MKRRFRRQPFILLSFSSSKKAQKAQETQSYQRFQHIVHTVFNTSGTNAATFVSGDCGGYTLAFANRIAHSGSHGETRGVSDGGAITTLGAFHTFRKPCVARCQNGKLCRFGVLVGDAPEERRKPSEQLRKIDEKYVYNYFIGLMQDKMSAAQKTLTGMEILQGWCDKYLQVFPSGEYQQNINAIKTNATKYLAQNEQGNAILNEYQDLSLEQAAEKINSAEKQVFDVRYLASSGILDEAISYFSKEYEYIAAPCALVDDESYIPSNDVVVLVAPDMLSESGIQELNVIPSGTCQMQNSSGFAKEYPKYAIIDDEWIAQVQADTQAVENIKAQMQEAKNQIDQLLQNQPQ